MSKDGAIQGHAVKSDRVLTTEDAEIMENSFDVEALAKPVAPYVIEIQIPNREFRM